MAWRCLGGYCFECGPEVDPIECPYADLSACIAGGCASPTYECLNGECVFAELRGQYPTLATCELFCFLPPPPPPPPPGVSYDCISGSCVDPGDGSGIYPSLDDCEAHCYIPNPIPAGCFENLGPYHIITRRVGCGSMLADYPDRSKYEIAKVTATCESDCTNFLAQFSDESRYEIQRVEVNAPCLCLPLPESCDHSATVLHAVVTSDCPEIDGAEFDLTYVGTDCDHTWRGSFTASNGCVLTAQVTCGCCDLSGFFGYGNAATCPEGVEIIVSSQCNPLVVTMSREACDYTQIGVGSCGTCAITVVVTL